MTRFIQVGNRLLNLDLVCGAERQSRGRLIVYLATAGGSGPAQWSFDDPEEAEILWRRLTEGDVELVSELPAMSIADRVIHSYELNPVGGPH